jgi:hypothetical protein
MSWKDKTLHVPELGQHNNFGSWIWSSSFFQPRLASAAVPRHFRPGNNDICRPKRTVSFLISHSKISLSLTDLFRPSVGPLFFQSFVILCDSKTWLHLWIWWWSWWWWWWWCARRGPSLPLRCVTDDQAKHTSAPLRISTKAGTAETSFWSQHQDIQGPREPPASALQEPGIFRFCIIRIETALPYFWYVTVLTYRMAVASTLNTSVFSFRIEWIMRTHIYG